MTARDNNTNKIYAIYNICRYLEYSITYLAVWPLLASGVIKLISLISKSRLLLINDPVLLVANKTVYAAAGSMEVLVSAVIFLIPGRLRSKQILLGVLAAGMAWYRWMRNEMNITDPCACLGAFGEGLPFPWWWLDRILISLVIVWLVIGAWGLLASLYGLARNRWRKNKDKGRISKSIENL